MYNYMSLLSITLIIIVYLVFRYRELLKRIISLRKKYEESQSELLQKDNVIEIGKKEISELKRNCERQAKEIELCKQTINKLQRGDFKLVMCASECYQNLLLLREANKTKPDGMMRISEKQWQQIIVEINHDSFRFTKKLSGKYKYLSEEDIRFCCLVKMGFKYSDIALLLTCDRTGAYKKKDAIVRNMQLDKNTSLEKILDDII